MRCCAGIGVHAASFGGAAGRRLGRAFCPKTYGHSCAAAQALAYARQALAGLPEAKAAGAPLSALLRDKNLVAHFRSVNNLAGLLGTGLEQASQLSM